MANSPAPDTSTDRSRRRSVFYEVGLEDEHATAPGPKPQRPSRTLRFNSTPDVFEYSGSDYSDEEERKNETEEIGTHTQSTIVTSKTARAEFEGSSLMYRLSAMALVIAILVPLLQGVPWVGHASVGPIGVTGGVIRREPNPILDVHTDLVARQAASAADVCTRWAHASAIINGTLYIYGGQASTEPGQTQDTWNNDFLSLDLGSSWQISSPALTGLAQPNGPPNVSEAVLWNSYSSLYLYGGEYSSQPITTPAPLALWEYDVLSSQWIEHSNPTTSSGTNAPSNEDAVQRSAEGAGISVPSLGRGYYFGGHQDGYTTPGWVSWIWRIYLQSLLEFTFPGAQNNEVTALQNNKAAGTDGNYRNVTEGGTQTSAGFPERADGLLLYVPGFGAEGILIGLAGGTNTTYQQMNEVDVFDIATSVWYKQATSGSVPEIRVNPCAVVAAAPDGSSYNVYMFAGQSLQPAGNQTLYNDMWILTIPSFTWISVNQDGQSVPYARAGHTCNIWNAQMVVVGGYVGTELSCDSPGIYIYDMSNLKWIEQYTALSPGTGSNDTSDSVSSGSSPTSTAQAASFSSNAKNNPLNQQNAQLANDSSPGGLEGSYGYSVPAAIQSVIGGASTGGATITAPAQTATAGPLKTGKPITYIVSVTTAANGQTVTETAAPGSTISSAGSKSGPNIAAIVAGVVAGLLFIVVCYLAFCAWLYRKQVALYKRHLEMSTAAHSRGEKPPTFVEAGGLFRPSESAKSSSDRRRVTDGLITKISTEGSRTGNSGYHTSETAGGIGPGTEPHESLRRLSSEDSAHDLLGGSEPTFFGTLLAPRRSLRVINRD